MIMSSVVLAEVKKGDTFLHEMCFENERRFLYPRKIAVPILRTWVRPNAPFSLRFATLYLCFSYHAFSARSPHYSLPRRSTIALPTNARRS